MSIVGVVQRAEKAAWNVARSFAAPMGILRTTNASIIDPDTLEYTSSDILKVSLGTKTNYSSEELNTLGDVLAIGVDSRKVIFKMTDFSPLVGDTIVFWDVPIIRNATVALLTPPVDYPVSYETELWVCDSAGTIGGGLSVAQGDLLRASAGSLGGTHADVGVDWQKYSISQRGDVINRRSYENLQLSLIVLDIRLTG